MQLERPLSSTLMFAIATLIWGSTWLGIKYQLGVVAPEVSVAYRFALAAAVLALWCVAAGRSLRFSRRQHAFIALQGMLLFGLNYVGVYWAEEYATSGLVAVLFSTIVFMNPVGARLAFGTPLSAGTFVAATIGVAGVSLMFLPELTAAGQGGGVARGVAIGLVATGFASAGNITAARNQRAGIQMLPSIAWGMGYGALVAAIAATLRGATWGFDPRFAYVVSLAYLAVFGSIIAFGAYLTLLKQVGPGPAAYVGVAIPVVALALSTLFEGYRWTWISALGVVLAVCGNWLALRTARPPETLDSVAENSGVD